MNKDSIVLPRWFNTTLILILIGGLLAGCSVGAVVGKSASFAVSKYCEVPESGREAVRKAVGRAVSPNSIEIKCTDG